jgi:hypothetical protein
VRSLKCRIGREAIGSDLKRSRSVVWSCGVERIKKIGRGNACVWRWRVQSQVGSQERPELEVVRNDMKGLGLARDLNHHAWMRKISGDSTDPGLPGAPLGGADH